MLASAIVDLKAARATVESNEGHSVSGMHALSAKSDDSDLELEREPWRIDPSTGSWRPAEKPAEGNTTQKRSRGANLALGRCAAPTANTPLFIWRINVQTLRRSIPLIFVREAWKRPGRGPADGLP